MPSISIMSVSSSSAFDFVKHAVAVLVAATQFPCGVLNGRGQRFAIGGLEGWFVGQLRFDGFSDARVMLLGDEFEVFANTFGEHDLVDLGHQCILA